MCFFTDESLRLELKFCLCFCSIHFPIRLAIFPSLLFLFDRRHLYHSHIQLQSERKFRKNNPFSTDQQRFQRIKGSSNTDWNLRCEYLLPFCHNSGFNERDHHTHTQERERPSSSPFNLVGGDSELLLFLLLLSVAIVVDDSEQHTEPQTTRELHRAPQPMFCGSDLFSAILFVRRPLLFKNENKLNSESRS